MISANELRIGNAIWDYARGKVKWVNHRVISDLASENNPLPYSPIHIAEEWLFRFGFTDVYDTEKHWLNKIQLDQIGGAFYYNGILIKYVHQLQNLYFALTGHELKIKNSVTT